MEETLREFMEVELKDYLDPERRDLADENPFYLFGRFGYRLPRTVEDFDLRVSQYVSDDQINECLRKYYIGKGYEWPVRTESTLSPGSSIAKKEGEELYIGVTNDSDESIREMRRIMVTVIKLKGPWR